MDQHVWWAITALCSALSAVAGGVARAYGERLKLVSRAEERREAREVSERDMWSRMELLAQRVEELTRDGGELRVEVVELRTENRGLNSQLEDVRRENRRLTAHIEDLSHRYERLKAHYDAMLPEGCPARWSAPATQPPTEGPHEGPSPVPGGDHET